MSAHNEHAETLDARDVDADNDPQKVNKNVSRQ